MKLITPERIKAALDKAEYYYIRSPKAKRIHELNCSLMTYGLRTIAGVAEQDYDFRIRYECLKAGYDPSDPDCFDKILEEWEEHKKVYFDRVDKITEVQVMYDVSVLEKIEINWKNHSLDLYRPNVHLIPTWSDRAFLTQQKKSVVDFWMDIVRDEGFTVWYRCQEWVECDFDRILTLYPIADWVHIFMDLETGSEPQMYLDLNHFDDEDLSISFVAVPKGSYPILF